MAQTLHGNHKAREIKGGEQVIEVVEEVMGMTSGEVEVAAIMGEVVEEVDITHQDIMEAGNSTGE